MGVLKGNPHQEKQKLGTSSWNSAPGRKDWVGQAASPKVFGRSRSTSRVEKGSLGKRGWGDLGGKSRGGPE